MVWLVRAPKSVGENATGELFGHHFIGGVALVKDQYHYKFLTDRGYKDVSPSWFKDLSVDKPERALLIRWGGIGDLLMSTPGIRALKEAGVEVHIAMEPSRLDLLKHNPNVDHFLGVSKHHLGHYLDQYDALYDFSGIIAGNTHSEIKNTYELYEEWIKLETNKIPEVHIPDDVREAFSKRLAAEWGIQPGDDLIVIHAGTSTVIRDWPARYTRELMQLLCRQYPDTLVCIVGLDRQVEKCRYYKCYNCRKWDQAVLSGAMPFDPFPAKCRHCGEVIHFTKGVNRPRRKGRPQNVSVSEPSNVRYFIDKLNLLEICCLVGRAHLVIGPDSGLLHVAAATETPCLGLFSSFDASLRLSTYPYAFWIQKPYHCGPCFLHHQTCPNSKRVRGTEEPLCMEEIKPKEVFDLARDFLEANGEFFMEVNRPVLGRPSTSCPESCPICSQREWTFIARKGEFGYYRCEECDTIVCYPKPDWKRQTHLYGRPTKYFTLYENEGYVKSCQAVAQSLTLAVGPVFGLHGSVFEIGCSIGSTLAEFRRLGWKVRGIDISKDALRRARYRWDLKSPEVKCANFLDYKWGKKEAYDLIVCHQTMEHFFEQIPVIEKMLEGLRPGGLLSITGPDADQCPPNISSRWGHFNTLFCGEHLAIIGRKGLDRLLEELNLEEVAYQKITSSSDFSWLVARKGEVPELLKKVEDE